ncbi:hypothetical protein [uncultured Thiohalocapsa sp.]|jgi:hypothetical protein|nr:hypothetical protein [uncultured Thiohalocapsa sp.]
MLTILFWVAVGIVVGWNLPQPAWAKQMQARVMGVVRELTGQRR